MHIAKRWAKYMKKREKYLGPTRLGGSGIHHAKWTHATLDYKVFKNQ
jgi:hypothetical protein